MSTRQQTRLADARYRPTSLLAALLLSRSNGSAARQRVSSGRRTQTGAVVEATRRDVTKPAERRLSWRSPDPMSVLGGDLGYLNWPEIRESVASISTGGLALTAGSAQASSPRTSFYANSRGTAARPSSLALFRCPSISAALRLVLAPRAIGTMPAHAGSRA